MADDKIGLGFVYLYPEFSFFVDYLGGGGMDDLGTEDEGIGYDSALFV
jgi:hypothetical protein